ncbi:MAG: hypothetical protein IJ313_11720 [Clostridia bacterium]|nr:hypothetical protein [Clostridia bacterium]
MAKYSIDGATLISIADAIREKKNTGSKMSPEDMPAMIRAITLALQSKTIAPSASAQTVKPDTGYDGLSQVTVSAMPTAQQATPSISVSTGGLITASAAQAAGYVSAGTKHATQQMTTQAGKTVTPGTAQKVAVAQGRYTTGAVYVDGDANLVAENIKSGVSIFDVLGTFTGSGGSDSGSSGGLPDGFSALASGTVTLASAEYGYQIPHGLGVTPNFFFVIAEGAVTIANNTGYMIAHFACKQPIESNPAHYVNMSVTSAGINSASPNVIKEADVDHYFNAESIMVYGFVKAGISYRWVAGVLDGIG